MTSTIARLSIYGLHGRNDISIDFRESISIFMGPNGVGKSTVLNVFVHLLSRQWQRLAKQPFVSATIEFTSGDFATVTRADCMDFISGEMSPRTLSIASALAEEGLLEGFLLSSIPSDFDVADAEKKTGFIGREIRMARNSIIQSSTSMEGFLSLSLASQSIKRNFDRKIIYLPTYRRIEQDITEVLSMAPALLRRVQSEINDASVHSTPTYTEFVRFGMDDIIQLIDAHTSDIKEYSRQQINSLSTRYLTAALRSRQNFERSFFNSLPDKRIRDVLGRVDDEELDASQRKGITELIKSLRDRQGSGRLTRPQEHIAGYFYMLAETHDRISRREIAVQKLADVLNKYIGPTKTASYDQTKYQFQIRAGDSDIPLSGLSSGEKQIVSLFATLMLSEGAKSFVVIDEPELSLSVLWQEILVEDIISIDGCEDILAVTHSPFIYGDNLSKYTRDLNDFIEKARHVS